jgi:hypothetical protein
MKKVRVEGEIGSAKSAGGVGRIPRRGAEIRDALESDFTEYRMKALCLPKSEW